MIVVVDPDFANLIRYTPQNTRANITKHTYPVVDPYRPLLALPQKAGSFKFKLACIGEESEWKIISSKAGAGYFGHNELTTVEWVGFKLTFLEKDNATTMKLIF